MDLQTLGKAKIFLFICLFFIAGVAAASFLPPKLIGLKLLWFGGLTFALVVLTLFWKNLAVRLSTLALAVICLAFWRYSISLPVAGPDKIWHYNGETLVLAGRIVSEPAVRNTQVKFELSDLATTQLPAGLPRSLRGKVLITTGLYPTYAYGDRIEAACKLETPGEFDGFDYARFLAKDGIYSVCYFPKIKIIAPEQKREVSQKFYASIISFKAALAGRINAGLPEPSAGLARGIILGEARALSEDLRLTFARTGLSHVVAISGMNITILSTLIMSALLAAGFWRRQAFHLTLFCLISYIILIGWPASAVRAGLMAALVLWAMRLGRLNSTVKALVFAAAALLATNPKLLRDDLGFQLSFLSTLSLVLFFPRIDAWLENRGWRSLKFAREALGLTIAAQILALPLLVYNFSELSLVSPLANVLVVWTLAAIMITVIAALPLTFILPSLAPVFFLPAKILLDYLIFCGRWLVRLPAAWLETAFWPGWFILYYLAAILIIRRWRRQDKAF